MSGFQKLLADLGAAQTSTETMVKALPAGDGKGDAKIQAAAGAGGEGGEGDDLDAEGKPKGAGDGTMAKSLEVTLADGTKLEAVDGTEMVKALNDRIEATEADMQKAMGMAVEIIQGQSKVLESQGALIKALEGKIEALGKTGAGRKTMVSIVEKAGATDLMKSAGASDGITADEFMAKANDAWSQGKISGKDLTTIDVSLRNGQAIDAGLIKAVAAATVKSA